MIDIALVISVLSLAVSTADILVSRSRSKRLEARETVIEKRETDLENKVDQLDGGRGSMNKAEAGAIGGRISGKQNVETGRLEFAQQRGRHIRWDVNRGIVNPACEFCRKEMAPAKPELGLRVAV